ncbi:MAG: response regulator, partial [Candidatus Dormiibacterota bacterium]
PPPVATPPAPAQTAPPAQPVAAVNPVADLPAAVPAPKAVAGVNGSGAQTILLIEDDERIAKFYTILFEAKGFNVENARDGLEGVDMASSVNPALILLDVMMPKMNGLMVLQTLRANPDTEHTPVVVLSNYMEPPLIQRALQLGAIEYVVKSQARPEQLVNALPSWLKGEPALH